MNVYITAGTYNFLKSIETKNPHEKMVIMVNQNGALLLHETEGASVFKEPRKYDVIDGSGVMLKDGFVVMNNIPVTDEGRPLFEHQIKNHTRRIEHEPGIIAIRFLRPLSSSAYIILTVWDNEMSYQRWQNSISLTEAFGIYETDNGVDTQPKIFASAPYVSKYTIMELDQD